MSDIWNDLTDAFSKDMAIDEMQKKYGNTYLVVVPENGKELVCMYKGWESGFHHFTDDLGVRLKIRHETDCKVICKFPERLLFNAERVAYEFIRQPTRQFRRGICKDNCSIHSPVGALWSQPTVQLNHKLIKYALDPKYPTTCEEAIKELVSNRASIALSPRFMLTRSVTRNKDFLPLWYMNKMIGYFKKDTFVVRHPMFRQEVLDNVSLFKPFSLEI